MNNPFAGRIESRFDVPEDEQLASYLAASARTVSLSINCMANDLPDTVLPYSIEQSEPAGKPVAGDGQR